MLSDEDFSKLVQTPFKPGQSLRARLDAAFALGVERARNAPDAATRAVIERLIEASLAGQGHVQTAVARNPQIQHYHNDYAVIANAIAEARKLLEGDALAQPADEDAWLKEADERFAVCERRLIAMADDDLPDADFMAAPDRYQEAKNALRAHLRTRPQQAGFVSVPVEPATDTKRLNFMQDNLMREASMRFDDGSFKAVNAWTVASAGKDLRAAVDAMIAAATKGDGK